MTIPPAGGWVPPGSEATRWEGGWVAFPPPVRCAHGSHPPGRGEVLVFDNPPGGGMGPAEERSDEVGGGLVGGCVPPSRSLRSRVPPPNGGGVGV